MVKGFAVMKRYLMCVVLVAGCSADKPAVPSSVSSPETKVVGTIDAGGRPVVAVTELDGRNDASTMSNTKQGEAASGGKTPIATQNRAALNLLSIKLHGQLYNTLPKRVGPMVPRVSFNDFAGASACKDCHADAYKEWSQSAHGLAGGVPSPKTVIAPFDGKPIQFADAVVTPRKIGARYVFEVVEGDAQPVVVDVVGVVGRGLMKGGGTQVFLKRQNDGRVLMLPFDYSVTDKRWFCQAKRGFGWEHIDSELKLGDCEWPPWRGLGVTGGPNCQNCHASQVEVTWQGVRGDYQTRWKSLTIDCESCHGPGQSHVKHHRSGSKAVDPMPTLLGMTNKESLDLCFRCHATKSVTASGYLAGQDFNEHYAHTHLIDGQLAALDAEGQVREFAYQEGHLSSPCYSKGAMVCTDCHTAHGLNYQDVLGNSLSGWDDDRQCTGCHVGVASSPELHGTQHQSTRCVSCHMPYRQHPGVGSEVSYTRSDHRISRPVEWQDGQAIAGAACLKCHEFDGTNARQQALFSVYGQVRGRDARLSLLKRLEAVPLSANYRTVDTAVGDGFNLLSRSLDWSVTKQTRVLTSIGRFLLVPGVRTVTDAELQQLTAILMSAPFEVKSAGAALLLILSDLQSIAGVYFERLLNSVSSDQELGFRRTTAFNLVGLWMSYGFSHPTVTQRLVRVLRRFAPQLDSGGPRIELFAGRTLAAVGDLDGSFDAYLNALSDGSFYGKPVPLDKAGSPRTIFKEMSQRFLSTKPAQLSQMIERLPPFLQRDSQVGLLKCQIFKAKLLYVDALNCLEEMLKRYPKRPGLQFHRANVLLNLSRQGDALKALEKGLANEPNDRQAIELYEFLKMKNWEKAR
jgi:tetratricopeptide (TPR) repeat protein